MRGDEPMEARQRRENMQTLFLSLVQNTIYRIINTSPLVQRDVNEETQWTSHKNCQSSTGIQITRPINVQDVMNLAHGFF